MVANDESATGFRKVIDAHRADRIAQPGEEQPDDAQDVLRQHAHCQQGRHQHQNRQQQKLLRGRKVEDRRGQPVCTHGQDACDA